MKIAVMTCGGDCAGLNAALRAFVICAVRKYGWEVYGISGGFWGLYEAASDAIAPLDVDYWEKGGFLLERGGTALGSSVRYYPKEKEAERAWVAQCKENFDAHHFDALVVVGGDVSLTKAQCLAEQGIPVIGIPKTIDNDVVATKSIGFATSVQVGVNALDSLRTTADSHGRVFVVEVMGRDAGFLPLHVAIAGGADAALIPEIPYDEEKLVEEVRKRMEHDRYVLIVASEAARPVGAEATKQDMGKGKVLYKGVCERIAQRLSEAVAVDVRSLALGHTQRGGGPVAQDRLLGCRQGVAAADALAAGKRNVVMGWNGYETLEIPLQNVCVSKVSLDNPILKVAEGLNIFLGR